MILQGSFAPLRHFLQQHAWYVCMFVYKLLFIFLVRILGILYCSIKLFNLFLGVDYMGRPVIVFVARNFPACNVDLNKVSTSYRGAIACCTMQFACIVGFCSGGGFM